MNEQLILAFQITLVGMGLVFGSILLLWGVMSLLVKFTSDQSTMIEVGDEGELKHQAAATAVAIAIARHAPTEPRDFPLPPTTQVGAWQTVMRTKMLNKRGSIR